MVFISQFNTLQELWWSVLAGLARARISSSFLYLSSPDLSNGSSGLKYCHVSVLKEIMREDWHFFLYKHQPLSILVICLIKKRANEPVCPECGYTNSSLGNFCYNCRSPVNDNWKNWLTWLDSPAGNGHVRYSYFCDQCIRFQYLYSSR